MANMHSSFDDVSNWKIIAQKTIHDYSENELPIEVVEVEIGTLYIEELDFPHQHYNMHHTPITRWISRKEYDYLRTNSGSVIW